MSYAERFEWIFETRKTNASALAEKAGLTRSHLRGILDGEKEGKKVRPGPETLEALAKAANVSFRWLSSGKGPREPYEGDEDAGDAASPTPAPASTSSTSDAVNQLIDEVMERGLHRFSDGVLVREALAKSPPPAAFVEPRMYVLRLLDTAAWHREQGHKVQAEELPALAVGFLDQELAKRLAPPTTPETTKKAS